MKTLSLRKEDATHDWFIVDASDKILGRLATKIADRIRGKDKPTFTPHTDGGDYVIVINADKIKVTGNKLEDKKYFTHTLYPGGLKTKVLKDILETKPEYIIEEAMKPLRAVYGEDIPNPDSFLITRWGLEPYILGSYSTAGYNQDDLTLRTELANPIENKIFFAGEATSVNEYGFTHSALNTGLREAKKIKELYPLDL